MADQLARRIRNGDLGADDGAALLQEALALKHDEISTQVHRRRPLFGVGFQARHVTAAPTSRQPAGFTTK